MEQVHDHEMVSIYPFSDEEIDHLMNSTLECVLMWGTKDHWPVGVIHSFVWHDGKVWITFAKHRHRTTAIKRDNRVCVNVSSVGSPDKECPAGSIAIKGHATFHDDRETLEWFYRALSDKLNPGNKQGSDFFYGVLDSPLRTLISVDPEKYIMFDAAKSGRHMAGQLDEKDLGEPLESDKERMNAEREKIGLDPREKA